jgi:hypothetical protein
MEAMETANVLDGIEWKQHANNENEACIGWKQYGNNGNRACRQ